MATYLELAQEVARDSGTVSGNQPVSVAGQGGRLGKIVAYTRDAWARIQTHRSDWAWMRAEFTGITMAGESAYTAASWDIPDFGSWVMEPGGITAYAQALGPDDEGPLAPVPWSTWRQCHGRAAVRTGRPVVVAVRPGDGALVLGPVPDGAYVVRGEVRRSPQLLAANTDVPALPPRFHAIIKWRALMLLSEHDEAPFPVQMAAANYYALLGELERDQLPAPCLGGEALA